VTGGAGARALRAAASESARYAAAAAAALALDAGVYLGLIRWLGVNYLIAAPLGFAAGLALIYAASVRWVFRFRRLTDRRVEFSIFAGIGLAGIALNQLVIYLAVESFAASFEMAKLASAAIGFCFNFILRKFLLFTRA
jgi:putative flippase GtrA